MVLVKAVWKFSVSFINSFNSWHENTIHSVFNLFECYFIYITRGCKSISRFSDCCSNAHQMEHNFSFLKFYMKKICMRIYSKTLTRFWRRMILILLL